MKNNKSNALVRTKRNPSIELMRVFLMFAIVMQHVACFGEYVHSWFCGLVDFGVAGFALLSGWYGIHPTRRKVVSLILVAIWYAVLISFVDWYLWDGELSLQRVVDIMSGWWYLMAYFITMMFAPLINAAAEWAEERNDKWTYIVLSTPMALLFAWIYLTTISPIVPWMPKATGVYNMSCLTLISIYSMMRMANKFFEGALPGVPKWLAAVVILLCCCVNMTGLGGFASPSVLLMTFTLFVVFSKIKTPGWLARVALFLSPSILPVYLLHVNMPSFNHVVVPFKSWLVHHGVPEYCMFWVAGLVIFGICIFIDLIRRGLLVCLNRKGECKRCMKS